MVNQFQGFGGSPYNYNSLMSTAKPLYDPTLPNGDCLPKVNGQQSALQYRMNPNSRAVLFDQNEDIFYIVTSDASGVNTVQAFSFTPYKPIEEKKPEYVTIEEFNRFKEEILNGQQFIRYAAPIASSGTGPDTSKGPTSIES